MNHSSMKIDLEGKDSQNNNIFKLEIFSQIQKENKIFSWAKNAKNKIYKI